MKPIELRVTDGTAPGKGTAAVFVGHEGTLSTAAARLDEHSGGLLRRLLELGDGKRQHGRIDHLLLPGGLDLSHLFLVTAGKPAGLKRLELEELGGGIVQALRSAKVTRADIASPAGLELGCAADDALLAIATGAALRSYGFERYKGGADDDERPPRLESLGLAPEGGGDRFPEQLAGIRTLAAAVDRARDLVNEPANALGPAEFAEACRSLAELGIEVEILGPDELRAHDLQAILAVGQGSARPPYAAIMRWRGVESDAPVALIGKGVCFDTGGISIKPAGGMEDMKMDMAGAAAVVGAMAALAGRRAKADVVGIVGLAENMPSDRAQRPGDIIRTASGKTIEVINTDAEGRLILADMLWLARQRFQPRLMVDLATLTGAILVALGHERAGLFASDDELAERLEAAGDATGERLWRMPMGKEYAKHVRSEIADIKNVGRARQAGATAGAVFLQHFAGEVPWAHLDIAGTAWSSRDLPLSPKGATGFGVRLLDRLIADHYEVG